MSKRVYAGGSSEYYVDVDVSAKIDNSGDNATVTITVSGNLRSGYWVQSSGIMFASSCDGQKQGNTSLLGNTGGGVKHSSDSNPYTAAHTYKVSRASARNISWSVDVYGSFDMVAKTSATSFSGTLAVTAAITYYTVTWKDGLGNTIETDTVASGGDATPPTTNPTRTGYEFAGWSGTYKNVTSNQVVNATWTPITYSVDIDCNGGSGVSDFTYTIESSNQVLPTPTREGYTFLGWTGSNGTTPQKSVIITSGSTGNKAYIANWAAKTFTITYEGNGGTCQIYDYDEDGNPVSSTTSTTYSEEVEYATEVYIRPNDDFFTHPEGKGFVNWNTEPDGSGDSWEPGTHTWDDAHDITLYAQWTDAVEFTVTFNANGGKFSDGSTKKTQNVTKGQDAQVPENPTRDGKQFQGWTANYKNVTANQVVNAIWGTGVLWIMTTDGWVKFE